MNKSKIFKLTTPLLLISILGAFTHCIGTNTAQIGSGSTVGKAPSSTAQDQAQKISAAKVSEGIKNYDQILQTMSALTGIPVNNRNVNFVFTRITDSLPTTNDIKVFLPSHQIAVFRLASEFCHELVETAGYRSVIWPDYAGFTQATTTALSSANRIMIIDRMIENFWLDVVTDHERQKAEEEYNILIDDLLEGEDLTSPTTTRTVIKSVCASALSSAHVILL